VNGVARPYGASVRLGSLFMFRLYLTAERSEMTLYTIGFTKKSAREFFERLTTAKVRRVVDIRLNNTSQLAGFAKRDDLEFFLGAVGNIEYVAEPLLAPSPELFAKIKASRFDWSGFARSFRTLMKQRKVDSRVRDVVTDRSCLLCSEDRAQECHRSLVADHLRTMWTGVKVIHL